MIVKYAMKFGVIAGFVFSASFAQAAWVLKRVRNGAEIRPVGVTELASSSSLVPRVIKSIPQFLSEERTPSSATYEEVEWPSQELPSEYARFAVSPRFENLAGGTEFRTIVDQGQAQNRICLTFVGDGYTEAEKERFFSDVARMVDDLFHGHTFASYTALFNVYAVFVPSRESGITDVTRKDTVFGLYRSPAGSKRAIMPGNPGAIDRAVALAPKTDYPIVIANDEFYGGLGGQYAITTRSIESGKIVLRHELGHNFGNVGEEYDGGYVYSGANSSATPDVTWKQWLRTGQTKVENEMQMLGGAYVWQNLATGPVVQTFDFPAPGSRGPYWFDVHVSSVGWESLNDVEILLDGRPLALEGRGTADRSFFNTTRVQDLTPGRHTLEINEVNHDGNNILAFADLYAYEADYDFSGKIGAFTTFDEGGNISYRPTHQNCIMRDMLTESFCSVDQENMWVEFLDRVRLIDQVQVTATEVTVKALKMGGLETTWFVKTNGIESEVLSLKNRLSVPRSELSRGHYVVRVKFSSPEIRQNFDRLSDQATFQVQ
jgi:hypothetical protein